MLINKNPPRPLLGFPLFFSPDEGGELRFPELDESVRQAIEVVLRTRPGEQLMRPDFGAGLDRFVGQPNTIATRRRMRDLIVDALGRWEDRMQLERVDVLEADDQPAHVRVELTYRLRRTGVVRSLALTMDLGG